MTEANNGQEQFHLVYAAKIKADIVDLAQRAKKFGLWKEYRDAWQFAENQLKNDPEGFGDPFVDLHAMGLKMMHRIVPPLHVVYGVDAVRKTVYLQSVEPFPPDSY